MNTQPEDPEGVDWKPTHPAHPDSLLYDVELGDWCGGHCRGLYHCVQCHDLRNPRLNGGR